MTLKTVLVAGATGLVDVLVGAGLASSRRAARTFLSEGAVYLNNRRQSEDRPLGLTDFLHGRLLIVRRGKASHHVVRLRS